MKKEQGIFEILMITTLVLIIIGSAKEYEKQTLQAQQLRQETELFNEQVVEKSKYCLDNGLEAKEITHYSQYVGEYVIDIKCTPTKYPLVEQGKKSQATVIYNQ